MTYKETVSYLFSRLPMFHRIGAAAYKANLNNIIALSNKLNHPENNFLSVHIAGTNGKGSVSNMLASVFQEAGYKTGLFTSPHLKDYRERIRIDGKMIEEDFVTEFVRKHKATFEDIEPSFFEWTTALAFEYFSQRKVDVAIIETGLGGRLDSTNIITPLLSVITNISFDHMQLLGDTMEKIAIEKAGIIKENIPVVIGERQSEIEGVFTRKAEENNSDIVFASDVYEAEIVSVNEKEQHFRIDKKAIVNFEDLTLSLVGNYQRKNICTVLQSVDLLKKIFSKLNNATIINGVKNVQRNTGLRGRWEILNEHPLTIADVGHNEAGIKFVMEQLESNVTEKKMLHIVFGIVNDKDPDKILSMLPVNARYYFCKADIPRALDQDELKITAKKFNLTGESFSSVAEAFSAAKKNAGHDDIIYIGGSTFVVAEAI